MRASIGFVGIIVAVVLLAVFLFEEERIASTVTSLSTMTTAASTSSLRASVDGIGRQGAALESQDEEPPIHVLFALSGSHPGFLAEFETALKSVLLNAPLERDLHVHVMSDREAYCALGGWPGGDDVGVLNKTGLGGSLWRRQITLRTYDTHDYIPQWKETIVKTIGKDDSHHTIGTYFRLFAHDVLPDDVDHFLYMDTDAVILANLDDLWRHVQPNPLFHWGADKCAGFVILNAKRLPELWDMAQKIGVENIRKLPETADQLILVAMNTTYPHEVAILPDGWETSIANGGWLFAKTVATKRPQLGMIHYNGGGSSQDAYFKTYGMMYEYPETWGLPIYYAYVPWAWARYQGGYSKIGRGEGKAFQIDHDYNASKTACVEVAPFTKSPTVPPTKAPVSQPPTEAPTEAPIKAPLASEEAPKAEDVVAAKKAEEEAAAAASLAAAKAEAAKNIQQ